MSEVKDGEAMVAVNVVMPLPLVDHRWKPFVVPDVYAHEYPLKEKKTGETENNFQFIHFFLFKLRVVYPFGIGDWFSDKVSNYLQV